MKEHRLNGAQQYSATSEFALWARLTVAQLFGAPTGGSQFKNFKMRVGVRRVYLTDSELSNVLKRLVHCPQVTLDHGEGWTQDVTSVKRLFLASLNVRIYDDWPHAGNGFTVDGDIVELFQPEDLTPLKKYLEYQQ